MKDAITDEEYFTFKDALILFGKIVLGLVIITGIVCGILMWVGIV